jgi:endonuclease G
MKNTLIRILFFVICVNVTFAQKAFEPYYPIHPYSCDIVEHKYYTVCMDYEKRQARWVMYMLTPEMAGEFETDVERKSSFRKNPLIGNDMQLTNRDYMYSGYDRGHLVPAEDMDVNEVAMCESFYYSNTSPQHPNMNRGIWKNIESQVRDWAKDDTVWVITGPDLNSCTFDFGTGSCMPEYFYKVVIDKKYQKYEAFYVPNGAYHSESMEEYKVTLDYLEGILLIQFVPSMDTLDKSKYTGF